MTESSIKKEPTITERKTVSLQETADILGISLFTVRKLVKTKKIKTLRFTERGQHLVPLTEIDRILKGAQ